MSSTTARRTPRQRAVFAVTFCQQAAELFAQTAQQAELDLTAIHHTWHKVFSMFPQADLEPFMASIRKVVLDMKEERLLADGKKGPDALPKEFLRALELPEQALAESGGLISSSEMQARLKLSKQALNQAVAARRLFSVNGPHGRNYYPAFYGEPAYPRRDLEAVCQALGAMPGHLKFEFFITPKAALDNRTPLQAILAGDLHAVLRAAAGFSRE